MRIKKGKPGGLFIVLPLIIVAFFALPVIFPDIASKTPNQGQPFGEDGQDESLPVLISKNPLSKYFKKLSNFYMGKNKSFSKKGYLLSPDEEEAFAMLEKQISQPSGGDEESINFAYDKSGNAIGIAADSEGNYPSFMYASGKTVNPTADGYYIDNKFYANGNFPEGANRRDIEKSLSKYHKAVAERNGKEATYIRQADGSVTAAYLSHDELTDIIRTANGGDTYFTADAARYNGAKMASRNASGGNGGGASGSDGGAASGGFSDAGPIGDFASRYDGIYAKISEARGSVGAGYSDAVAGPDSAADSKNGGHNHTKVGMKEINEYMYREPNPRDVPIDQFELDESFKASPVLFMAYNRKDGQGIAVPLEGIVLDTLNTFVKDERGGLARDSDGKIVPVNNYKEIPPEFLDNKGTHIRRVFDFSNAMQEGEKVRIFALNKKDLNGVSSNTGTVFYEYIRAPFSNPAKQKAGQESFKEVFYERKGLKNILEGVGISEQKRIEVEKAYDALDKRRTENRLKVKEVIDSDPNMKNFKPKVLFFLGSDSSGNAVVATPNSFAYLYAPGLFPTVLEKDTEEGKIKTAYKSVPLAEFEAQYLSEAPIVVTTNPENKKFIESRLRTSVIVIPDTKLTSSNPDLISDNIRTIVRGVIPEIQRRGTEKQKGFIEEMRREMRMKAEVSSVNKTVNGSNKGVNATAANTAGPLRNAPAHKQVNMNMFNIGGTKDTYKFYNPSISSFNTGGTKGKGTAAAKKMN